MCDQGALRLPKLDERHSLQRRRITCDGEARRVRVVGVEHNVFLLSMWRDNNTST